MKIPKNMRPWLEAYGILWGLTVEEVALRFISDGISNMVNNDMLRKTQESFALARKINQSKGGSE